MVFKNVLRNKSLAEIKENCTLDGRSYCDVLACYNLLYGIPYRVIYSTLSLSLSLSRISMLRVKTFHFLPLFERYIYSLRQK